MFFERLEVALRPGPNFSLAIKVPRARKLYFLKACSRLEPVASGFFNNGSMGSTLKILGLKIGLISLLAEQGHKGILCQCVKSKNFGWLGVWYNFWGTITKVIRVLLNMLP